MRNDLHYKVPNAFQLMFVVYVLHKLFWDVGLGDMKCLHFTVTCWTGEGHATCGEKGNRSLASPKEAYTIPRSNVSEHNDTASKICEGLIYKQPVFYFQLNINWINTANGTSSRSKKKPRSQIKKAKIKSPKCFKGQSL